MSAIHPERILELQARLDDQAHGVWRKILHTLALTGVADNQQIIQATQLNRDKLRRTLDKMCTAAAGLPPLFSVYERKLKRTGAGAAPRIYLLKESGAALCKLDGLANAHPCQLDEPRAILHALGMLDVHLAAVAAGLEVKTDQRLHYDAEAFIRPDNLIGLPDATQVMFESEQDARLDYLERILRSLANKKSFFEGSPAERVSPIVRMLVDLPRGKLYVNTIQTWRHAVEISRETHGELPFRLLAMPLTEFMADPDWSPEPQSGAWIDLTTTESLAIISDTARPLIEVAEELPLYSDLERRMVLAALYQDLKENGIFTRQPQLNIEFLYAMRLIYMASHDPFASPLVRGSVPRESLYLLDHYLHMIPGLQALIDKTIQIDGRRIHWNQSTALHRMQVVVNAFLEFHGWQSNGPLLAYAYTPDYQAEVPRHFSIVVQIREPELLMTGETAIVPGEKEIKFLERSLAWVLTSLFAHSAHLGLRKPPFW